jgi:hypothetical protein
MKSVEMAGKHKPTNQVLMSINAEKMVQNSTPFQSLNQQRNELKRVFSDQLVGDELQI